ncbi:MAG: hypothetical protein KC461_00795, partial [Dehalococcoidia bacterium]|nr:hypothetical protein [Dehalococcoidia bacterium]
MSGPAPLRVVLAVGDPALEARLGRELPAAGVVIRSRALDGPGLLAEARAPGVDAVLVDARLHRLDAALLDELRRLRVPVVILGADAAATAREGNVVPVGSTVASIAAALHAAAPRHAPLPPSPVAPEDLAEEGERARVVVVAGGKGAPGRTFVAIALADVLGAAEDEVVLVDGDLRGGNVAPYLDLDPRRGLLAVAGGPDPLPARLAAALQPGAHSAVLSGIERPELARRLPAGFLAEVVDQLRVGRDWVLVDAGHPAPPGLLAIASDIVVVTGADLVSIWNTRVALPALRDAAPAARLHLVVNRREGREHYTAAEIGVVLALPVLGAVREDRGGARRAIAARRPL